MEQHMQYLIRLKSKQIFQSQFRPSINSFNNSWEEQAFAEDTAGPLGGFMWPPRSYSCTFCRREFRSAQALGGHMNVHRRDRARLKQSSLSPQPELLVETPPPFPAGDSPHPGESLTPYSSISSVILSPQNSTTIPSKHPYSPQGSDSSNSGNLLSLSNQKRGRGLCSNKDIIVLDNEDRVDTSLSIGLSLRHGYKEERHNLTSKRQRMKNDVTSLLSTNRYLLHTEVVISKADECVDLELRLGD